MTTRQLSRDFHALRPEVFRAWTDGAQLARWFRPRADLEAAPARPVGAGRFELALAAPDGSTGVARYVCREVVSPERLVLDLEVSWGGSTALRSTGVRVAFEDGGETTRVTVAFDEPDDERARALLTAWNENLDRLPAAFDEALERFYSRLEEYPRFRSRFGGLWPDLVDAEARIAGRVETGLLDAEEAAWFRHWMDKGYVHLPGAVPEAVIDRLAGDIDRLWEEGHPEIQAEVFTNGRRTFEPVGPACRDLPHKVLDLHGYLESARAAVFAPAIRRFATKLFERPALAFQSLYFTYGTEQDLHQDTAYVVLRSPMEFCGCWIGLEDVEAGAGELEYYEGSHRIPEYVWFGRGRGKPYDYADDAEFLAWVREEPERRGMKRVRFRAKKGDALLWHADLVHGGSRVEKKGVTRRSLVTHLCPKGVEPEYFGAERHSPIVDHGGAYTCHQVR